MATLSTVNLGIVRNVANADITVSYTVLWSAFDQTTNLSYSAAFRLIGDDTFQDGDNLPVGDDPIVIPFQFPRILASNGQVSTTVNIPTFTIAFAGLDEDGTLPAVADQDDEIRAVVTLTPLLPVASSRESAVVLELAP